MKRLAENWLKKKYDAGLTQGQIAEEAGCSRWTIIRTMKRLGIEARDTKVKKGDRRRTAKKEKVKVLPQPTPPKEEPPPMNILKKLMEAGKMKPGSASHGMDEDYGNFGGEDEG